MKRNADYIAGWIDTTIHDYLAMIDEPSSSMAYALITCLDSSVDVAGLLDKSPALEPLKAKCVPVGEGVLLTTRQLLAAERCSRIFFGFDEVWFFDRREVAEKPKGRWIVGPARITEQDADFFSQWMHDNGCSLGLGDGVGMNFCARLRGVAGDLVRAFNEWMTVPCEGERATATP